MHADLSSSVLTSFKQKPTRIQRPSTASPSTRDLHDKSATVSLVGSIRPQSASIIRQTSGLHLDSTEICDGGSEITETPKKMATRKGQARPQTSTQKKTLSDAKHRDYERPWSANPYLDSPSRNINKFWGGGSSLLPGTKKMKRRPKTSGLLRKKAMPKKLTTSAFWGDITKGHASSLEIASKTL